MFTFLFVCVILSASVGNTLSWVDRHVVSNDLADLLRRFSEQTSVLAFENGQQKREALEVEPGSSVFGSHNLPKANHYWTRKRGRESTIAPQFDKSHWVIPTVISTPVLKNNRISRKRREIAKSETENSDQEKQFKEEGNSTTPIQIIIEVTSKAPLREKPIQKNQEKRFYRRFPKSNKCCVDESDFSGFNGTLLNIKSQCLVETRKNRKASNDSDETFDDDGGLYNLFSCDRVKRWKALVTCTLDCIARKIGMIDSNDVVNVEVAKRVVSENFAKQKWEIDVSDNLVVKCVDEISKSTSQAVDSFGYQCKNSKAAEFVYCMWRELFLTCPVDKQTKSKQCDKTRSVLGKSSDNKFRN